MLTTLTAVSPRTALATWFKEHPLPAILDNETLQHLLASLPVPTTVRRLLRDCLYQVPAQGLFALVDSAGSVAAAIERPDLVDLLVRQANSIGPRPATALVLHGLRRTGKSFSIPWAQAEAIARLRQGPRCSHLLVGGVAGWCRRSGVSCGPGTTLAGAWMSAVSSSPLPFAGC